MMEDSASSQKNGSQPKRQRSCDLIDSKTSVKTGTSSSTSSTTNTPTITTSSSIMPTSPINTAISTPMNMMIKQSSVLAPNPKYLSPSLLYPVSNQMKKTISTLQTYQQPSRLQQQQQLQQQQAAKLAQNAASAASADDTSPTEQLNILLDPIVINDYPTQALLLTVLATLVRNSTDENEIRVLYSYIAESSIVFSKVFPVIHNLLDSKINHIIQLSLDESILDSVQSIIQNMISSEYINSNSGSSGSGGSGSGSSSLMMNDTSYQQQLSYLQACGFGGLWRFAQPFAAIGREKPENVELFIDCLEAMVETCLVQSDGADAVSTISGSFSHCSDNVSTDRTNTPTMFSGMGGNSHSNMASVSNQTIYQMGNSATSQNNMNQTNNQTVVINNVNTEHNSNGMFRNTKGGHQYYSSASFVSMSSQTNLIGSSMSSLSLGSINSPGDFDLSRDVLGDLNKNDKTAANRGIRRNSSPKNMF